MGKISLEGMEFYAHHGYYQEERTIGNKYRVDISLEVDFSEAAIHDELASTVNYEKIYDEVKGVMQVKTQLLEHLAHKIITSVKSSFSEVKQVHVRVSKYNPPIKGLCERASVELSG